MNARLDTHADGKILIEPVSCWSSSVELPVFPCRESCLILASGIVWHRLRGDGIDCSSDFFKRESGFKLISSEFLLEGKKNTTLRTHARTHAREIPRGFDDVKPTLPYLVVFSVRDSLKLHFGLLPTKTGILLILGGVVNFFSLIPPCSSCVFLSKTGDKQGINFFAWK